MPTLPERLAECVNVVGAVTSALCRRPALRRPGVPARDIRPADPGGSAPRHGVGVPGRRPPRPPLGPDRRADRRRTAAHDPSRPVGGRPSTLRPGFFQRLWRLLHTDPTCLPYAWSHREGRLVCRLRSSAPDEEKWVASEHLADRPEIELRIAAPPRTAPRLLEVVFPGATTIHEAKGFIFRELGELPVQAQGRSFRWHEDAGPAGPRFVRRGGPRLRGRGPGRRRVRAGGGGAVAAPPGAPVRWSSTAPPAGRASGPNTGWKSISPTRSLGRTALLNAPHRSRPALARFLSALLFDGAVLSRNADDGPAVEFVPVPSLDEDSVAAPVPALPRGGRWGRRPARRDGDRRPAPAIVPRRRRAGGRSRRPAPPRSLAAGNAGRAAPPGPGQPVRGAGRGAQARNAGRGPGLPRRRGGVGEPRRIVGSCGRLGVLPDLPRAVRRPPARTGRDRALSRPRRS